MLLIYGLIAIIFFILSESSGIFYLSLIYYIHYIFNFIKFRSFNIVYLAHVFISIYFIFGLLIFNIYEYREFFLHNIDEALFSNKNLTIVNFIYFISLILLDWFYKPTKLSPINNKNVFYKDTNGLYSKLVLTCSIAYLVVLIFSYYYLNGRYIWFIQETKGSIELKIIWQLISSGGLYLSALLPFIYINERYNKNKFIYLIVFLSSITLLMLGIRMYAMLLLFPIIINMQLRGFIYEGYKIYLYYIIFGLSVLIFAIFRFQTFDYTNTMAILETVAGEFVFPHSSAFYIIINPLSYDYWIVNLQDLLLQIMPASIRVEFNPILEEYTKYLLSNGLIAGYGGYFLVGQLYFYFGFLFFIPLLLISKYFNVMNNVLFYKKKIYLMSFFSIFILVLPRMQIWTMKAMFYTLMFFLVFNFLIKKIKTKSL